MGTGDFYTEHGVNVSAILFYFVFDKNKLKNNYLSLSSSTFTYYIFEIFLLC